MTTESVSFTADDLQPPRTFGDLLKSRVLHWSAACSFCKRVGYWTPEYKGARKYSARHYICDDCIEPRKDVVLPAIRRRERIDRLFRRKT